MHLTCYAFLRQAAKALGISATALKKACRKLGNNRWPVKPPASADTPKDGPSPIGLPVPPVRMPSPTPSATSSSQTNSSGGRGMYPVSAGISPAGGAQWPNWAPSKPSDSSSAPGSASDSDGSTNGSSSTDRNSQKSGSHRGTKGSGRDTATSRGKGKLHPSGQEKQCKGGMHSSGNKSMDPAMQMTWWCVSISLLRIISSTTCLVGSSLCDFDMAPLSTLHFLLCCALVGISGTNGCRN